MKVPFEEALASVAAKMGMTSIELLQHIMHLKQEEKQPEFKEPDDDYIDAQCELAEREASEQ